MAKFYVQSGTLKAIVDSADADRAALWAIHTAMEPILSLESNVTDVFESSVHETADFAKPTFFALGENIQLSEIGFDREDALQVSTLEAFRHWSELWSALERLERTLFKDR